MSPRTSRPPSESIAFHWLHFSDLHFGLAGQNPLWPNVREAFFEDLRRLCDRTGPWDVVFFTGDLVQQGRKEEFDDLEKKVFRPLWQHFEALGKQPLLLAVPGNHDLVRPDVRKPAPALKWLLKPDLFADIADDFFDEPDGDYRAIVESAFVNYAEWWSYRAGLSGVSMTRGIVPGDFAASIPAGNRRIGVVGLNSAFLQLAGGDYRGKLAWDVRQFHAACGGDGPAWVQEHDLCFLLTHHGPGWLNDASRGAVLNEINPAGRFAVHLFGHEHELEAESRALGGGRMRNQWQGASLFGMEKYGQPPTVDRRHGYSAGRLEIDGSEATVRLWPRRAVRDANGWRFIPDHENCVLDPDEGTSSFKVPLNQRRATSRRAARSARTEPGNDGVKLDAYVAALLRTCDIINLAGLPEADRNLAMERFLLRNLYVPLRVRVDIPADKAAEDSDLARMEQRRLEERLQAAGRTPGVRTEAREAEPVGARLQVLTASAPKRGKKPRRKDASPAAAAKRLLVLGDPGSGKTTLLRWIATAYLLRLGGSDQREQLPDASTLPDVEWCPVLVRCRELDQERLRTCALIDLLRQAVHRLDIPATQAVQDEIAELLKQLLIEGRALLLVDGLDEITDPAVRAQFCEQLDQIAAQYEKAPILVTSRIVGYREMNRRLSRGFEHTTLADLTEPDKDGFVDRWCDVTELPERRATAKEELRAAVHSSDRIERLTGNPMLLTTLALVKRKVGKLPSRRHELYREAVEVLLNWRTEIGERLDRDEALPQLQYVAHAMCRDGRQQLRRDEILALLRSMRDEYPHIAPIHRRTPEEFLRLLEARTSLLVEMGEQRHNGRLEPVYEFRHLTFQEYLAGLALVEGRYAGHDRTSTLAERIAPLAGQASETEGVFSGKELLVTENWREALRLAVSCCNDDDVDAALRAIVTPRPEEDASQLARPRAILAALCLADEPNVSRPVAEEILEAFAREVRHSLGRDHGAVLEIGATVWRETLAEALSVEYVRRPAESRTDVGSLYGTLAGLSAPLGPAELEPWLAERSANLRTNDSTRASRAALELMQLAFEGRLTSLEDIVPPLMACVDREPPVAAAASWALLWLTGGFDPRHYDVAWKPSERDYEKLIDHLATTTEPDHLRWLAGIARNTREADAASALISRLRDGAVAVRRAALSALREFYVLRRDRGENVRIEDQARETLSSLTRDLDKVVRSIAVELLPQFFPPTDRALLSLDLDGVEPWLEPGQSIGAERIQIAQKKLKLPQNEVRQRYTALAETYPLRLEW